jgi:hypothetical protein
MRVACWSWVAVLWLLPAAHAVAAEDAYFVIVFGAQRPLIKDPRYSHSFAAFAHLTPDGRLETFTISWLPRTAEIHPLWIEPEEGCNFDLCATLRWCRDNRMVVACWGPYQIHPDLWRRALWQKWRLESGQVLYKAFDDGSFDGRVSNCVHAISFITRNPGDERPKVIVAPANWGESGSYWIALALRPWFLEPCCTHDWLFPYLGLNANALIRNGLDRNPTLNPITRATQAALHTQLLPNRVRCDRCDR